MGEWPAQSPPCRSRACAEFCMKSRSTSASRWALRSGCSRPEHARRSPPRSSPGRSSRCSARARSITGSPGRPPTRLWLRRLDHAGIFGLIAGTYTPFGLLVLHGNWQIVVLAIVWGGASVAILAKLAWVAAPKWLSAAAGITLGWVAVAAFPQILDHAGRGGGDTRRSRGPLLHRRRRHLRAAQARSGAARIRVPRALPRTGHCSRGVPVRGRRPRDHRLSSQAREPLHCPDQRASTL